MAPAIVDAPAGKHGILVSTRVEKAARTVEIPAGSDVVVDLKLSPVPVIQAPELIP